MTAMHEQIEVLFATGNSHKVMEANLAVVPHGLVLKICRVEKVEIQADTLEAIAAYAARLAADKSGHRVVCEDSGLFITQLGGFPGPYTSHAFKTIGCSGILKLMAGLSGRHARFQSAVSFCGPGEDPTTFLGAAEGFISTESRGSAGFGFDPIFVPAAGDGRTFAEMDATEKGRLSHRGEAFSRFALWTSRMAKLK